jgi:prophage antirepressor-like protein
MNQDLERWMSMSGAQKRTIIGDRIQAIEMKFFDEEDQREYEIQAFIENDTLLFIGSDVCDLLAITNVKMFVASLATDQYERRPVSTLTNGVRNMLVLKEGGFYRAVLRSRKPLAKPFKRWVCEQVLPTIRRNGSYSGGRDTEGKVPQKLA